MRASVKPQTVFLRQGCILPDRLDPVREPVCEGWTLVQEIPAPDLDSMIRRMGWHFLTMNRPYARKGFGFTHAIAAKRALERAFHHLARQYNSAELVSLRAGRFLGFHVAHVTLQPRQIQQFTSLEVAADWEQMIVPTR
jgi:hypothetical protein